MDASWTIKVADFGLARALESVAPLTEGLGTFQWMAPEVLARQAYSEKADVYAFGIVVWEACARQVDSLPDQAWSGLGFVHDRPELLCCRWRGALGIFPVCMSVVLSKIQLSILALIVVRWLAGPLSVNKILHKHLPGFSVRLLFQDGVFHKEMCPTCRYLMRACRAYRQRLQSWRGGCDPPCHPTHPLS